MHKINIAKVKNNLIFRILTLVTFLGLITLETFAQGTGKIVGKVTDEKTGETLIGLSVKVVGATRGASTGVDGRYTIAGLTAGRYTLEFSYMGYQTKKIADIDVKSGEAQVVNVVMKEGGARALKEVVVNVSAKKESTAGLYAQQKNSAVVSDGVSSDAIKKSPDKNTSEVLKRVSGATIQDNKFVVVRGLSDRYNNATLDNGALPSTEPNRKAFSFDIVPANMVDAIVIKKTASPDMAADFAGGSVAISTRDIPDSYFLNFAVGYSYNSQSTFKTFLGNQLGVKPFLGISNGSQLPASFPSTSKIVNGISEQQQIAAITTIKNNWGVNTYNALPGQNYQISLGNVKDFKSGKRLGATFSLTYRSGQNTTPNAYKNWHVYENYNDDTYKLSTSVGALANIGYSYGNSKISLRTVFNKNYDNQYLFRTGHFNSSGRDIQFYAFDEMQKTLFKTTLEGDHRLGTTQSKIRWTASYSNVGNNQPDQRKVSYGTDNSGVYYANVSSAGKENARTFSDLKENIFSGDVAYSLPIKFFGQASVFKTGVSSQYRKRDFTSRFVGMVLNSNDVDVQNSIIYRPIATLYDQTLIDQGLYKLDDVTLPADKYDASALTNAGYVMLDNKIGEKLRAVWGVRAEQYLIKLTSKDVSSNVDHNWIDILPSANLTYSLSEKANIRASASRTLARPELREMAHASYYDYELMALQTGNPNLKRTNITNTDLRWEYYPSAGQILSASVFYKHFHNAIEPSLYDNNSSLEINYINSANAYVYGIELEFRKTLDFIGDNPFYKNTSIYSNISLMKSETKVPIEDVVTKQSIIISRPLVGQSPYVINAGLQHAAFGKKLNLSVLYNRIGRRINKVQGNVFPNVWENPRDLLDFQLGYKLLKQRGELKFNVNDILNQNSVLYLDADKNEKYSSVNTDPTVNRYKPGTNFSLSFSYSIR